MYGMQPDSRGECPRKKYSGVEERTTMPQKKEAECNEKDQSRKTLKGAIPNIDSWTNIKKVIGTLVNGEEEGMVQKGTGEGS